MRVVGTLSRLAESIRHRPWFIATGDLVHAIHLEVFSDSSFLRRPLTRRTPPLTSSTCRSSSAVSRGRCFVSATGRDGSHDAVGVTILCRVDFGPDDQLPTVVHVAGLFLAGTVGPVAIRSRFSVLTFRFWVFS